MPNTLETISVSNFNEFLEQIECFQGERDASWYRGCVDITYKLIPSLFRHAQKRTIEDLSILESQIAIRFVQRSQPFLNRTLQNDWDKLFLMQHYGVPTRLLDWSENPFVAAYFALSGSGQKLKDAALWMCDPIAWNRSALQHISFSGGVLDESSDQLRTYALGTPIAQMPKQPIMVYGTYNSPRIVAQRGGFALFGHSVDEMEKVYKLDSFSKGSLRRIIIPKDKIIEIRESLFRKGFTESVVFPDLDGLSKEMKRVFGF
ncbi:FRG domain-containing protein [Aquibium sp. ELW1220]|uniref:FRG domain-containing protein n=1 Tax=Aquibium sp. ELW1220 TaxID=2976766 RepID=UPI0025B13AB4|nr:FRG domain-containing protein [Aquibium sp. ELW1220]MDN2581927.1 FRG domain-containing protein [Aquibium sp. ELW1220]